MTVTVGGSDGVHPHDENAGANLRPDLPFQVDHSTNEAGCWRGRTDTKGPKTNETKRW